MAVTERLKTGAFTLVKNEYRGRAEFFALPALATKNVVRNPVLVLLSVRINLADRSAEN
jgi:hypothetical protein